MKSCIFTFLFLLSGLISLAQDKDKLFDVGEKKKVKKGFILNGNAAVDLPGGDMAKRFGLDYRLGPALLYKTKSNWLFGAKFDFIMGNTIYQDSFMINIRDKYSTQNSKLYEFINNNGERVGVPVLERGYVAALQFGKIFSFSKLHPDNGLVLMSSLGFIQHKINIVDKTKAVSQLSGDYKKGYDRLTNGLSVEAYVGYIHFSGNGLLNFTLGPDVLVGFTQGRRSYLYDVMRPDNESRTDILFGLRGGWFIPVFRKNSEDIMFE